MTALHTQKGVWKKMLIIPSVKQLWGVMGDKKLNYTQARISFGLLEPRWDHFLYRKYGKDQEPKKTVRPVKTPFPRKKPALAH